MDEPDPWEIDTVGADRIVIAYTGATAPAFAADTNLANLTPVKLTNIFYRKILSVSDAPATKKLTLMTMDVPLAEIVEEGTASLTAGWRRNRNLCVNLLIHGHLCVCGFGRSRRDAHRYTFTCQKSLRNSRYRSPEIPGLDGTPRRRPHRASGRDGPDPRGGKSLMSIHCSHICHIGGADQGRIWEFSHY
jgi:hypothetical protein